MDRGTRAGCDLTRRQSARFGALATPDDKSDALQHGACVGPDDRTICPGDCGRVSQTPRNSAENNVVRWSISSVCLGGSLAKEDMYDFILGKYGGDRWRGAKKGADVEIDWTQFHDVPLIADIIVRGGTCRVGLLDVENEVTVLQSDWIPRSASDLTYESVPPQQDLLEPLRHFRFEIPPSVGRKAYRLVVQPSPSTLVDDFWVLGFITFPVVPLGGSFTSRFTPTAGEPLAARAPTAVEASVDWSTVQGPITTVIADVTLAVWYPVFQTRERARCSIRDLTDGTISSSEWQNVEWTGGMMASGRPYPGPTKRQLRIALPRKMGVHKYVLEVEVSKAGMVAGVAGVLALRH